MNFLVLFLVTLLGINVFASEVLELKAGINLAVCEHQEDSVQCSVPAMVPLPISIVLKASTDSSVPSGEQIFYVDQDGYRFEGEIFVMKMGPSMYVVSTALSSSKKDDPSTYTRQQLGEVYLKDVNDLNRISWWGQEVRNGNISLKPVIIIDSQSSHLKQDIRTSSLNKALTSTR